MSDREFAGHTAATTLASQLSAGATSINLTASSGWPTGTGANTFVLVVGRGLPEEEKILCDSRSGVVVTVAASGRGYDGTSDQTHAAGTVVEHCVDATWMQEVNEHFNDSALDQHPNYLNAARHDIEARHTFGAALGTPVTPPSIAVADVAGAGNNPAREDHTHQIDNGSVPLAKLAVDPLARANHTGTQLSATISDLSTTTIATIASLDGLKTTGVGVDNSSIEIAVDLLRLKNLGVATQYLQDASVTTAKINDAAVTPAKLDPSLPRGFLGEAHINADSGLVGSLAGGVVIPGMVVGVTVGTSRRIKVTVSMLLHQQTAHSLVRTYMKEGGTQLNGSYTTIDANEFDAAHFTTVLTPTAGAHTYSVFLSTDFGFALVAATATAPAIILVEDIGSA